MYNMRKAAEDAVRGAGKLFLDTELFKNSEAKTGIANFVTQIDYMVQEFLLEKLEGILPGSNVITEESNENQYSFGKPTWILDPVDGTTNLMHQYRHSAVSLALINDGKPALGIIYNPYSDEMFIGESGKGAYLNDKVIKVTDTCNLKECLIGFGTTPYDRDRADITFRMVRDVFMKSREIRRSGSAALDIAYVACGRLDGFFEMSLQPWDFAAGSVILEEAGGKITNWKGEGLSLLTSDSIIATNGLIYGSLKAIIQEIIS